MAPKRLVLLISGTPGTGKSTLAQELKYKISATCINLTEIALENNFILETDVKRRTEVVNLEKLVPFLKKFIKSTSDNLIIEGHYADIVPDALVSVCIILRTDPQVLEHRLNEKQFFPSKIQENLQAEILGLCTSYALESLDPAKIYEVDTSHASLEETIRIILDLINKRPISNVGEINWMQKLEDNNELMKYFR